MSRGKSPKTAPRQDRGAVAEKLTLLADQLQVASAELLQMVNELRVQHGHDIDGMEQELKDE
jgi:hypothetical protein